MVTIHNLSQVQKLDVNSLHDLTIDSRSKRCKQIYLIVIYLAIHRKFGKMVDVRVDSRVKCEMGKKPFNLTVKNCPADSTLTFKKVGNSDLTLLWPAEKA